MRGPDQPGPVRSVDVRPGAGGSSVLALASGTGLEYALRLPEAAELRFTPRLPGGATLPAHFRVELTLEGEPAREVYSLALERGDDPPEARVPLPGVAGRPALLGLHLSAGPGAGAATGEWVEPRVLGRPEPPAPEARPSRQAVERLRGRLEGAAVLLIVLDAAAAGHFGCYGYERDTTPEIDRIAAEGVVLERAYSPASYTGLAMASLWTSQHPEQHHHGERLAGPLPEGRVVLPELLQTRGTPVTAFVGNLNAGKLSGLGRGFADTWPLILASKAADVAPGSSSLDRIEASLVERGPGPHLTYLHYLEPHFPYNPPPPFDTRFGREEALPPRAHLDPPWFKSVARGAVVPTAGEVAHLKRLYDGNLAAVDHEIGQLRRRLEDAGRWDDLLVIVTADHGETFLQHGQLSHAAQVYEESVRIPLVIKLPGETRPARFAEPVDLVDLGATLADALGVASAAAGHFRGRSLVPLLAGESLAPRAVVARNALERPTYAFVDGRLKLVHDPRWGATELYDLEEDPGESRDLSATLPVTTELLRQSLYRWLRDLDRGAPATGSEAALSPEDEAALRALGYLD